MVTAATYGERQPVVAGVRDTGDHVGYVSAANDCERVAIYCAVVDGPRFVVFQIGSNNDLASDSGKIINT
jgi:hypothetical protein